MEQIKGFGEYTLAEQDEIYQLVIQGGEVNPNFLAAGLQRAQCVGAIHAEGHIVGTASLKRPQKQYVEKIEGGSGSVKLYDNGLLELGYINVLPPYRGNRLIYPLLDQMLECNERIISTTKVDNLAMIRILLKYGFRRTGKPYQSEIRETYLQAFIREKK